MLFSEPTLVSRARVQSGRDVMEMRAYGERASRDGDISKIGAEVTIAKAIGRVLQSHYPGHPWFVEVMADQGVAKITIPPLLGMNFGYILHLDKLDSDAGMKSVVEAGGHILERFEIPRSTIDLAAYIAAEEKNPLTGFFRASHADRIPT